MTTNGDVLIRVENLQKAFGDFHALNGITEEIHKGEVVVIIDRQDPENLHSSVP